MIKLTVKNKHMFEGGAREIYFFYPPLYIICLYMLDKVYPTNMENAKPSLRVKMIMFSENSTIKLKLTTLDVAFFVLKIKIKLHEFLL